jgi:hypothetical protein
LGKAILHIHTTFSDGLASVDAILDHVEHYSDVDVVGFTDHDDVRAYQAAVEWKRRHPDSRVQPLWGCEVTTAGFKHLLAYCFEPPFPTEPLRKFQPLAAVLDQLHNAGCQVVIPHVDAFWIGLGRRRLLQTAEHPAVRGYELLTPIPGARRAQAGLHATAESAPLLPLGGSDAHHLEDLFQVVVEFPGRTLPDFADSLVGGTATPQWGSKGPTVPLLRQVRQHTRALVVQPSRQLRSWARAATQRRPAAALLAPPE